MKKFSIRYKLCLIIIISLAIGFVTLDVLAIKIMKSEVLNQIKNEDTKLVDAFSKQVESMIGTKNELKDIQKLMDDINEKKEYNYVLYMKQNEAGEVVSVAHSNHERIGIVLDDPGSIAATKEGTSYCGFYTDEVSGKRTLDVLSPIYDKDDKLAGAFNIGVPVDEDTINSIAKKAILQLLIMSFIIAIVVIAILLNIFEVLLIRPIGKLGKTLNKLTSGDLSVEYKIGKINARDELDFLSKDVKGLIDKLRGIVQSMHMYSSRLEDNTQNFSQISSVTNDGVASVSKAMDDVAQGATNQAEDTSTAMARIEELSATLEMIITQITALNTSTKNMETLTSGTRVVLNDLIKANTETKSSVNDIVAQSNSTLQAVEEIDNIIKTIDDIASQTNLLSLNASIEAARAGDAGKGFAVVASEIGNLANNSVESAKQIGDIIERIKRMIEKSAELSNQLNGSAENQVVKLKDTEKSIDTVIDSVNGITVNTKQINDDVVTLEQIKKDIGEVIENLAAISQENAASAEETAASTSIVRKNVDKIEESSKEIENIAGELYETIKYFKQN